jgi:hypothetical protein
MNEIRKMKTQRIHEPNISQILEFGNGMFEQTYNGLAVVGLNEGKGSRGKVQPYFGSPVAVARVLNVRTPGGKVSEDINWFAVAGNKRNPRIYFIESPLRKLTSRDIYKTGILNPNEVVDYWGITNRECFVDFDVLLE